MKEKSSNQKTSQQGAQNAGQTPAAGPDGISIAAPAYGMDVLDQAASAPAIQRKAALSTGGDAPGARPANRTGLPDALKAGVESLSGLALDDVRVHYNSPQPRQLQALAYTQGTDIHVGPGQERHISHEAWHVVQQKQGRVKPTRQLKSVSINDEFGLEKEADVMGKKALLADDSSTARPLTPIKQAKYPIQRKMGFELEIPVTFLTDQKENVATKMAFLNSDMFRVEGDGSPNAGQMKGTVDDEEVTYNPTILEIVTHPIDEHAEDAEEKFQNLLLAIEMFRFRLSLHTSDYKEPVTLDKLVDDKLTLNQQDAAKYLVNYPTDTPRQAGPESAYIHFTVGVSINALRNAGKWVSEQGLENYPGQETHKEANSLILSSALFALEIDHIEELPGNAMEEMENFLYLAYGHVRAIDRQENPDTKVKGGGSKKNYTPLLSRASFANIFKNLGEPAQAFIVKYKVELKAILAKKLHEAQVDKKAHGYLDDIFNQSIKTQREYFGGMVVKPVERTGPEGSGLVGPPVEIRSLGTELSEEGIRQKVGEVFMASRSQFKGKKKKSPFSLDMDYVLGD